MEITINRTKLRNSILGLWALIVVSIFLISYEMDLTLDTHLTPRGIETCIMGLCFIQSILALRMLFLMAYLRVQPLLECARLGSGKKPKFFTPSPFRDRADYYQSLKNKDGRVDMVLSLTEYICMYKNSESIWQLGLVQDISCLFTCYVMLMFDIIAPTIFVMTVAVIMNAIRGYLCRQIETSGRIIQSPG